MKNLCMVVMLGMFVVLCASTVSGNAPNEGDGMNITISPSVLVVGEADGDCVTVHSNIKPGDVVLDSLKLTDGDDEIDANSTGTDDQGYLVVKFLRADVEKMVEGEDGEVELTLRGRKTGEDTATDLASDTIKVKAEDDDDKNRANERKKTGKEK